MNNNLIRQNCNVEYDSENGRVKLDLDIVRNVIAKGNNFSELEIYSFIKLCQYQRLNPFLGEAHLIKFGDNVQMVVGIDVFTNRLDEHPLCEGWKAGLIVERNDELIEREGTFYRKNKETIVGAWFRCKRSDWNQEFPWTITLDEYFRTYYDKNSGMQKPMKNWAEMPATMLVKCVIASGARKIFTKDFKGTYSHEEIGAEVNGDNIIDIPLDDKKKNDKNKKTGSNSKPLFADKNDIDKMYKAMKSNIITLNSEEEYKVIEYVINALIKKNQLKAKTTISNIPKNMVETMIIGIKQTIEFAEKKEKEKNNNDSKIIEMEYNPIDSKNENNVPNKKDNKNVDENKENKKESKKSQNKQKTNDNGGKKEDDKGK
jgi:phage recombination protein Bet